MFLTLISGVFVYIMSMILFAVNPEFFWESYIIGFVLFFSRLMFDVLVFSKARINKANLKKQCLSLTKKRRDHRIKILKQFQTTSSNLEQTLSSLQSVQT